MGRVRLPITLGTALRVVTKIVNFLVINNMPGYNAILGRGLIRRIKAVKNQAEGLLHFEVIHIPREQNVRADALAKLASSASYLSSPYSCGFTSIWHIPLIGTSFAVPNDLRLTCNAYEASGSRSEQEQSQKGEDRESEAMDKLMKQRSSFTRSFLLTSRSLLAAVTKGKYKKDMEQKKTKEPIRKGQHLHPKKASAQIGIVRSAHHPSEHH
ncbi:hypothetical protein Taro_010495 [Colocasia esculenta]|uniref:Uncharacterized protein n=1 Tax=Colocasia esculenta TaxID=4460 RepID=A0A843U3G4_COLES|nr:hypothetical protein [Colocasia esculenta]